MRCRFSEDGKFVVSASEDRTIRIFALPNVFKETKEGGSRGEEKEKYDVVFLKCVRASEVIFGHNARCWDCEPLSLNRYGKGSLDVIATTCEDRNVRVFEAPKDKNGFQEILVNGKDNYTLQAFNENNVNVQNEERFHSFRLLPAGVVLHLAPHGVQRSLRASDKGIGAPSPGDE